MRLEELAFKEMSSVCGTWSLRHPNESLAGSWVYGADVYG